MQKRRTQNTEETNQTPSRAKRIALTWKLFQFFWWNSKLSIRSARNLQVFRPFHMHSSHSTICSSIKIPRLTSPHLKEKGYPQIYPFLPAIPHASLTIHSEHPLSSDRTVGPEETGKTLVARDPPEVGAIGVWPIGVWPPLLQ